MAVNEGLYRALVNHGLAHAVALILADPDSASRKEIAHQEIPAPPKIGAPVYWAQDFRSGTPDLVFAGVGTPTVGAPLIVSEAGPGVEFRRDNEGLYIAATTHTGPYLQKDAEARTPETISAGVDITVVCRNLSPTNNTSDDGSVFTVRAEQGSTWIRFQIGGANPNLIEVYKDSALVGNISSAVLPTPDALVTMRARYEVETGRLLLWNTGRSIRDLNIGAGIKFGSRLSVNRNADKATGDTVRLRSAEISAPKTLT